MTTTYKKRTETWIQTKQWTTHCKHKICECGHAEHEHNINWFWVFGSKCETCCCPKFKFEKYYKFDIIQNNGKFVKCDCE